MTPLPTIISRCEFRAINPGFNARFARLFPREYDALSGRGYSLPYGPVGAVFSSRTGGVAETSDTTQRPAEAVNFRV